MRISLPATLASAVLLAGCPAPVACTTSGDCAEGYVCVNNECTVTPPADSGVDGGPDPAADAGTDGGRVPDAGSDAGPDPDAGDPCLRSCGDVDVDGDGDVDDTDFAALPAVTASDPCLLRAADADRDESYDAEDEHILRALASGSAAGECTTCGGCGDLDDDGDVDGDDATATASVVSRTPTPCEVSSADIDRDLDVDQLDAWLLAAAVDGRASLTCEACEASCGDVNGDGEIDILDTSTAISSSTGETVLSTCAFASADVIRDGVIDRRDAHAITRMTVFELLGDPLADACGTCTGNGLCGDLNGDGMVGSGDGVLIGSIGEDEDATLCERAMADLNADGEVNVRDAVLAAAIFLRQAEPAERCPFCSQVCGDINQDGGASAGDIVRLDQIRGGDMASICERDGADINGDQGVDEHDARLMAALSVGTIAASGPCPICSGVCGDVNGDGMVTSSDRTAITTIETSGRKPTPCELDDGDVDHDGDVDADDSALITQIIGGTTPAGACGR